MPNKKRERERERERERRERERERESLAGVCYSNKKTVSCLDLLSE